MGVEAVAHYRAQVCVAHDDVSAYNALMGRPDSHEQVPRGLLGICALRSLFPLLLEDQQLGLSLDGLVHSEQHFAFVDAVLPGEELATKGHISKDVERRGMRMVTMDFEALRGDGSSVLTGTTTLLARGKNA